MGNRSKQAYGLTLLSPILGGDDVSGRSHDAAIRDVLRGLGNGGASPFADMDQTHLARWCVIDYLPFEGVPARVDMLASKYLLFTSCFDGDLDPYLENLRTRMGAAVDALYRHCVAFPGVENAERFAGYMKRCQLETSFFFGAYAHATLEQVLRALEAQRRVALFIEEQQGAPPAATKAAFQTFLSELRSTPTPRPGTI
jgi:hypothetical protein